MIHGIVGTPRYFDPFISTLPDNWSIYNILLDGHGGSVSDFSRSSMDKWKSQVNSILADLSKEYNRIVVFGHSMGTLLAINSVIELGIEAVSSLVLFSCPLKPRLTLRAAINSFRVIFKITNQQNPIQVAAKNAYSISPDWRIWRYLPWILRYLELLALSRRIRKEIFNISLPCLVFHPCKDEVVSCKSISYLESNPIFSVVALKNSMHYFFNASYLLLVKEKLSEWLA